MHRNSINELKNIFSEKELLNAHQQFQIRGGDGEDDDKRRDNSRIPIPPPPPILIKVVVVTN